MRPRPIRFSLDKGMWIAYYLTPDGEKPLGEYESKREAELAVVERYYSKLNDELKKREKKSQKASEPTVAEDRPRTASLEKREAENPKAEPAKVEKTVSENRPEKPGPDNKPEKQETHKDQRQDAEENTNIIRLRLSPRNDKDILKKLESVSDKQTYIKELIRQDLNKKSRK